jgi:putative membrane protein
MSMSMLIPTLFVGAVLVAAPVPQAPPATPPATPPAASAAPAGIAPADVAFLQKAAEGGLAEVKLAKMVQGKAENGDVKAFAARLERDHTAANEALTGLAAGKSVTLPTAPAKTLAALEARLSKVSGAAFDRAYVAAMIDDHRKDIAAFEKAALHAADPEVKAFAEKTLPTLKDHLQQAQGLSTALGKASS